MKKSPKLLIYSSNHSFKTHEAQTDWKKKTKGIYVVLGKVHTMVRDFNSFPSITYRGSNGNSVESRRRKAPGGHVWPTEPLWSSAGMRHFQGHAHTKYIPRYFVFWTMTPVLANLRELKSYKACSLTTMNLKTQ